MAPALVLPSFYTLSPPTSLVPLLLHSGFSTPRPGHLPFSTYDVVRGVSSCMMRGPRILCSWTRVSFGGLLFLPGSGMPSILWPASSSRISLSMSSARRGRGEGVRSGLRKRGPSSSSPEDSQELSPAESVWVGDGGSCPRSRALCNVSATTFPSTEVPSSSSDQAGGSPLGRLLPLRIPSPGSSGALRRWGAWGLGG